MAANYGNTTINSSRSISRTPKVPPPPIIDEENPIPSKYEGDIIFNKTIYSKGIFENKVDTSFSELSIDQPPVNIEEFFSLYNSVFFDIPKEGENSHTTIIQTSQDFVDNYRSPLQDIIDSKDIEIDELNRQVINLQQQIEEIRLIEEQEQIEEEIAQSTYIEEYGEDFVNNPQLKYGKLKQNLETLESRNELRKSLNKNLNDLRQAKEKEDNNVSKKSYNQWNDAIDKRAEGRVKDDLRDLISATRTSIASGAGWEI